MKHDPKYCEVNGLLIGWELIEDGSNFKIISEGDTCCQYNLFFNNTREFAFHMENHQEGQTALTMLDPQYFDFCIFDTDMPRGRRLVMMTSIVIPLPNAQGVIPRVVEEEAAIARIVNDQSAPPLENVEVN